MKTQYFISLLFFVAQIGCNLPKNTSRVTAVTQPPHPTTPANIQSIRQVEIKNMDIDSLTGLPLSGGSDWSAGFITSDSLVIDLDNVPAKDYTLEDGKLVLKGLHVPTLAVNPSNEAVSSIPPYRISALRFKKIIVMRNGQQVQIDTTQTFDQNKFKPQFYSTVNPKVEEKRTEIKDRIAELEDRLDRIKKKIEALKKQQPDHAADMLFDPLDKIGKELANMKAWHQHFVASLPALNVDLDRLFSIDITFDDMEYQVEKPQETVTLETKVLFGSGEYWTARQNQKIPLDKTAGDIINRTKERQKERPGRIIVLNLKVTGYADDQDVSDGLAKELEALSASLKPEDSLSRQDYLNKLLSERRAQTVITYLVSQIKAKCGTDQIVIRTEAVAKGRLEFPKHLQLQHCPGDCPSRRVVVISDISFSDQENGGVSQNY